ncbi:MAG: metallophosphoesterase [Gemmatimonadota bacterium]|nr:metallophosphoesterase [Gemmatimonadota bacterium]MDH5804963.1 metallophosphoesterase [Gemmatimonadota bacterium]
MRLGVISDTHGTLPNQVLDIFSEVDLILHAGDVGSEDVILALETIAPVTFVFGNTDGYEIRSRANQVEKLVIDELYVTVTHGDQYGAPGPQVLHEAFPEADVLIFGHTHKPLLKVLDHRFVTVMNPGSAGAPRGGHPASVGIMETEPGIPPRARLVPLD